MLAMVFATPTQWQQVYDPMGRLWVSTLLAGTPLIVLMVALVVFKVKAHLSALLGAAVCIAVAIGLFHMPVGLALTSAVYGAAYGIFPIFWVIFPVIFLYQLTVKAERFGLLQGCITGITQDSRLQLLLIAFALGAFFEGIAGFGTPVAVCATLLIGFGFNPIKAAGLALLGNTAPVAFGSLGIPVIALAGVTGLDLHALTVMIATILIPFYLMVPFWLVWAFAGFAATVEIWPALLLAGVVFGVTETVVSRLHGPWLMDISAAVMTIAALLVLLKFWKPKRILNARLEDVTDLPQVDCKPEGAVVRRAMLPWVILTVGVVLAGLPTISHGLDRVGTFRIHVWGLDNVVLRVPPAVTHVAAEPAVFVLNLLSATGTAILISATIAGFAMGLKGREIFGALMAAVRTVRFTAITIASLMSIGFVSRYCGLDATLGLALAGTGALYPFFGTFIGWIGTASTGSDTSSNVLFGSLQKMTAVQLGLPAVLMAAANSAGGVMGKMVSPQNVVVASTAVGSYGKEGSILRFVILHSVVLAGLVGVVVCLLAMWPGLMRLAGL